MPRGQRGVVAAVVDQTLEFPHIRQPPVALDRSVGQPGLAAVQRGAVGQRRGPGPPEAERVRFLQPDQTLQVVRHPPVPVVRKPRARPRHPLVQVLVVTGRVRRRLARLWHCGGAAAFKDAGYPKDCYVFLDVAGRQIRIDIMRLFDWNLARGCIGPCGREGDLAGDAF